MKLPTDFTFVVVFLRQINMYRLIGMFLCGICALTSVKQQINVQFINERHLWSFDVIVRTEHNIDIPLPNYHSLFECTRYIRSITYSVACRCVSVWISCHLIINCRNCSDDFITSWQSGQLLVNFSAVNMPDWNSKWQMMSREDAWCMYKW